MYDSFKFFKPAVSTLNWEAHCHNMLVKCENGAGIMVLHFNNTRSDVRCAFFANSGLANIRVFDSELRFRRMFHCIFPSQRSFFPNSEYSGTQHKQPHETANDAIVARHNESIMTFFANALNGQFSSILLFRCCSPNSALLFFRLLFMFLCL